MKREVAVVPHSPGFFGVQCRTRRRFWPWFGEWKAIRFVADHNHAWPYDEARKLADQALANGVVPSPWSSHVYPVIEKDSEVEA